MSNFSITVEDWWLPSNWSKHARLLFLIFFPISAPIWLAVFLTAITIFTLLAATAYLGVIALNARTFMMD